MANNHRKVLAWTLGFELVNCLKAAVIQMFNQLIKKRTKQFSENLLLMSELIGNLKENYKERRQLEVL